jgi:hypothetical protein
MIFEKTGLLPTIQKPDGPRSRVTRRFNTLVYKGSILHQLEFSIIFSTMKERS